MQGQWSRLTAWLLEVEMGVAWGLSGLSLISFIFTSIWYIDPALLTMVLQFQPADCTTTHSAYLVGISNCTWTSCRHGCTSDIYKCWHILVNFSLVSGSRPIPPPWASLSSLALPRPTPPAEASPARLYPNARGCGYPPHLQCQDFFDSYGDVGSVYPCWVSHLDPTIALTHLDLKKLKEEVMYSLVPLASFILSTLYALCRLRVFSICNPFRCCPRAGHTTDQARLTPKQLFRYKKTLMARKNGMADLLQGPESLHIPSTIPEGEEVREREEEEVEDTMEDSVRASDPLGDSTDRSPEQPRRRSFEVHKYEA